VIWLWAAFPAAWIAMWPIAVVLTARFDAWSHLQAARPRHVTAGELKKLREARLNFYIRWGILGPLGLFYLSVLWVIFSSQDVLGRHAMSRAERRCTDLREIEGTAVREERAEDNWNLPGSWAGHDHRDCRS
jgi:hypothetical protein